MKRRIFLTATAAGVWSLSGCSRFQNQEKSKREKNALLFQNNDSVSHHVEWILRYLGESENSLATTRTEKEVVKTGTIVLEPSKLKTLNGIFDEEGFYNLKAKIVGSELNFDFKYPDEVNKVPIVYGIRITEDSSLGQISRSIN